MWGAVPREFPCNAVLLKGKLADSPACLLCGGASQPLEHTLCRCPLLKDVRIQAHHNLAAKLWGCLAQGPLRWKIHSEVSVAFLSCVETPLDRRDTWQRTCDKLAESDLGGLEDDSNLCAWLLRKRPDALAIRWGEQDSASR